MNARALVELVFLSAIWGASFMFQRIASPVFGPVALVTVRVGIAAAIIVAMLAAQKKLAALKQDWWMIAFIGAINSAIPFTMFAFATLSVSAGVAAVLNGGVPFFTAIIGWLVYRERLDATKVTGLSLGFLGLLLVVSGEFTHGAGGAQHVAGIIAGLSAAVLYAFAAQLTKRKLSHVDPLVVAGGSQLAAVSLMIVPALFLWPDVAPHRTAWGSAIVLGVACTGLAYVLFFRLMARVGAVQVTAVAYLIPVFGVLWGALFLHEQVTSSMLIGAVIVLFGVALTTGQATRLARYFAPDFSRRASARTDR